MHFPVIEITEKKLPKEEWLDNLDTTDDSTILYETDYVADPYNKEEREEALKGHITNLFEGIATINYEDESLTFLSKDEIVRTILEEKIACLNQLLENVDKIRPWYYDIREAGKYFRDNFSLFWRDGFAQTSAQFIEDAIYYAGKTLYFGNILDAHV